MMNEMTPADIAAVTGNNSRNDDNSWGGNGAWWIIILFLFVFCGWGGNGGFGGFGGGSNSGGSTSADIYRAVDQQTLLSKLDQQTYGICDSTFTLNNAISSGFANAELSRCNQQSVLMAQLASMSADAQNCCCQTQRLVERGFADTNYNLATQSCDTRNTIQNTTRDIIDNQNSNARAILDALNAQQIAAKDAKIAEQTQTIFGLQLAASQQAQNNYIVGQLKQCPIPAYVVANPYASANYCGCNSGCGC
ncbi:MAG: hypothetical protein NC122_04110 [Faecalibacterium sp.]|nr:hypothetical protein [Ruminococcus sp.]MCM1391717.1 hypothetical protein [Ruminococcus sp.]MCM1485370.1 hypothetical protein [Faecalibacterium sp.]